MPAERVAVLGIGNMGGAMARRLAEQGYELVLFNRSVDRAQALAEELSATVAATPADAAANVDVVITMVSDDGALRHLCTGPDGVLEGVGPSTVTVQTSTVMPNTIRELGHEFSLRGRAFIDSPVSGSVTSTLAGQLTLMVAGDAAALARARPVLEALSTRILEVGDVGDGAAVKLAVNHIIMSINVAVSEALVLAEAAGVERATAYEVFATGAAGAPYLQYKRPAFLEPGKQPVAFSMELAEKDMLLIEELGRETGTPLALAAVNLASLRSAAAAIGGERDFSELATYLRAQQSHK